jgi:predicted dithiol-disulfide oxidoreductase (DUF899 family)
MDLPNVASAAEWQAARDDLLVNPHLLHVRACVEALGSTWTFLDLTPLGPQEVWEDSPAGYPQTSPYRWWRRHDEHEGLVPRRSGEDAELIE